MADPDDISPAPTSSAGSSLPGVDWDARQANPVRRMLNALERLSLALETPIVRWVRNPAFNPLYHTGTITVLLLLVILVTGVYLTFFYQQFGFDASYVAVGRIESNLVGRTMRALHRYASQAAVVVGLLHAWRTFFQDRFRGARWLAWVSGVVMAVMVWAIGVTGYWLVWDERAQLLNFSLYRLIDGFPAGAAFIVDYLAGPAAGSGWVIMLLLLVLHLGLSALVGLFFWLHIKRLNRPKLLPPRYWNIALLGVFVLVSLALPVRMLAAADQPLLPAVLPLDPFYLGYLPLALRQGPWLFWGAAALLALAAGLIPWLLWRRPLEPIRIAEAQCTGCTLCAADCPYKALSMVPRTDGRRHKFVALLDPSLCVSCGICIGSCGPEALSFNLPARRQDQSWEDALRLALQQDSRPIDVIFTCERHAVQGARRLLDLAQPASLELPEGDAARRMVVPVTCLGMVHPDWAGRALQAGAARVQMLGCPPEDCANREGNLWLQRRLDRLRLPKLRTALAQAPVFSEWLAPNDFRRAIAGPQRRAPATAYDLRISSANWKTFLPALGLLALAVLLQMLVNDLPYRAFPESQALVEITLEHHTGNPISGLPVGSAAPEANLADPIRLVLLLDEQAVLDQFYQPQGEGLNQQARIFEQQFLPAGEHQLRLELYEPGQAQPQVLYDAATQLTARQALRLAFHDQPTRGDPAAGERLFSGTAFGKNAGCANCHSLQPEDNRVGPSLAGVAQRAASRVPGLGAEEYLRQSIIDPTAYTVPGYSKGQMPPLSERLTEQELLDLLAFLMTLQQ